MNWKKLHEKIVFKGWRGILQKTFVLPDGTQATYDIIQTNSFVTIIAFTKAREAILVKQFRPGPEMPLISFPEGMVEEGENPKVAAARELLEETGYQANEFIFLKKFKTSYSTENQICLLALDCEKISTQQLDSTEFIEVMLMPIEKLRSFLTNSSDETFTNVGGAYLALDYMKAL